MINNDQIRQDQITTSRNIIRLNSGNKRERESSGSRKGKAPLKGHEAFLKALEVSGATVFFEKASSGVTIEGVVKHSDKYTVSVQCGDQTRVLFKHDISEFWTPIQRGEEVSN